MEASRATESRPRTSLRQLALRKRPSDRAFEQLYRTTRARSTSTRSRCSRTRPTPRTSRRRPSSTPIARSSAGERPHKPHNWLITIAHNVCRMRWRQAGSRPREVALDEAPEPAARDARAAEPRRGAGRARQLTFNQRAAIVMRELEGRSYQEISERARCLGRARWRRCSSAPSAPRSSSEAARRAHHRAAAGSLASFLGAGEESSRPAARLSVPTSSLKAAAVVAVGAAAAGVGFKSVQAMTAPHKPARAGLPDAAAAAPGADTGTTAGAASRPPAERRPGAPLRRGDRVSRRPRRSGSLPIQTQRLRHRHRA